MNQEIFDRMLAEFQELNTRTNACRDFILDEEKFNALDPINRDLLIAQLKAMETYLSILSIRLGINGSPEPQTEPVDTDSDNEAEALADADAIIAGE